MATRIMKGLDSARRVLIVDDHDPTRQLLIAFLRRRGLDVLDVSSGADALATLAQEDFDLVLLDLWLGDITGLEILRQLRAAGNLGEFVMMSGDAELNDVFAARRLGVAEFLHKPFELERLSALLTELMPNLESTRPRARTLPAACGSSYYE